MLGQLLLFTVLAVSPWWVDEWSVPVAVSLAGFVLLLVGLLMAAIALRQLGDALTALPAPRPGAMLVVVGLYRWMRHPIYTGVLVAAVGWSALLPSWWTVGATVALALLLTAKSGYEETLLRQRHADYAGYARTTPRFVPHPRRRSS